MSVKWTRVYPLLIAAAVGGVLVVAAQVALHYLRPGGPPQTLAVVDGKPITISTFQHEVNLRGGEGTFSSPEQRRALLDDMIRVAVLSSNAQKSGLTDDPDVKRAMDRLLADLQVGDSDLDDYYRDHLASFTTPRAARAAVVFIAVLPGASDDTRKAAQDRAQHVHDLAQARSSFGELASKYSDDEATRSQGGDVGWLAENEQNSRWDRAVVRAIFELTDTGMVSPIISTDAGFYVVKLTEDRPAALQPFTEVRNSIRQQLIREQRQQRAAKLYAAALANVQVSINEAGVAAMEAAEKALVDIPRESAPQPKG